MSWTTGIRQTHRWLSIAFTLGAIINIVAVCRGQTSMWIGLLALGPLIVLQITGLVLFVLPYTAAGRRERQAAPSP
jgi:hypothetical protein